MAKSENLVVLSALFALAGCVGRDTYVEPAPTETPHPASGPSDASPDGESQDDVSVVVVQPADSRPGGTGVTTCGDGERRFATTPNGSFSWTVRKADGSPVIGHHAVQGTLAVNDEAPLATPTLELSFNREGAFTGQDLRDQRLGSAFFATGDALRFTLVSARAKDGSATLPEEGATKELGLTGKLEIAGKTVDVDLPVLLSRRGTNLHVSDVGGSSYKIRADWGLGTPLDALLALAQAKIEETVTLRFALELAETCGSKTP